jgi:hypothetical protein
MCSAPVLEPSQLRKAISSRSVSGMSATFPVPLALRIHHSRGRGLAAVTEASAVECGPPHGKELPQYLGGFGGRDVFACARCRAAMEPSAFRPSACKTNTDRFFSEAPTRESAWD